MSKPSARPFPIERQRARLQKKHAELAQRVAALDNLASLTPSEALQLQRLKKEKLRAKDALEHHPLDRSIFQHDPRLLTLRWQRPLSNTRRFRWTPSPKRSSKCAALTSLAGSPMQARQA